MKLPHTLLIACAATALASSAWAGPAEDIITAEKCSKCHTATTTKKGPSWASVAEKYKGKPEMPEKLLQMLKTGVPLSGKTGEDDQHKKVTASDADLKAVVGVVLSTK
jgi:cytochrome c551/c552